MNLNREQINHLRKLEIMEVGNELKIIISPIEEYRGDIGFHCTGILHRLNTSRLSFTAGLPVKEWDQGGWRIGLLNGNLVGDDKFKEFELKERMILARKIINYLNENHWKGETKQMGKQPTHKQLQSTAENINVVFALDRPISKSLDVDKITQAIHIQTINKVKPEEGLRKEDFIFDGSGAELLTEDTIKCLLAIEAVPEHLILVAEELIKPPAPQESNSTTEKEEENVGKKKTTAKKTTAKKTTAKKTTAKKTTAKKTTAKKTKKEVETKPKTNDALIEFNVKSGTKNHDAVKLFTTGKYTMAQIKEKLGVTFYNLLNKLKINHTVVIDAKKRIKLSI